jgi:hypothetical protein
VSVPPLDREMSSLDLKEMVRLLNQRGYGIIGAKANVWERDQILHKLKALDDDDVLSLLSMQTISCDTGSAVATNYHLAVFRKV